MGRPISETTKFILALPRTLSAKEVLTKAKASGHKTSEGNVHRVRRLHGGKKASTKKASTATTTAAPSAKLPQSKADFVHSLPPSTPAKKVIAKAKAAGLSVSETYVYALRRSAKVGAKKTATKRAATGAKKPTAAASSKLNLPTKSHFVRGLSTGASAKGFRSNAEDLLRAVAAELGLRHALEILESQRAQVRAVLGG